MNLSDVLQIVNIVIGMEGDKETIINNLVNVASRNNEMRPVVVVRAILQREERKPSNYGNSVALPHALTRDCENIAASIAILKSPVDWKTPDKPPVQIVLLIIGSHRQINSYISIVARAAKVLSSETFREGVLKAKTVEEILNLIKVVEKKFNYA